MYFIVHTNVPGAVSKALAIAKAADVPFNAGSWMRPVSMPVPEDEEEAQIVRELMAEQGLEWHESTVDLASY